MPSSIEIVRAKYPAYDAVPDTTVTTLLELATQEIGLVQSSVWGDLYGQALAALAAHMLEIRARSAASVGPGGAASGGTAMGPSTSVKTDKLSVSFGDGSSAIAGHAAASLGDAVLATTVGGQDYLRLRARLPTIGIITI